MSNVALLEIESFQSEVDSSYKKILDLREAMSVEDNLLMKYNTRSLQVSKSNWKLDKKESDTLERLNYTNKTMAHDSKSVESYKGDVKCAEEKKKLKIVKSRTVMKEKNGKNKKKFFNFYKFYDSKNISTNISEHRTLIEKKSNGLNITKQKENSCKKKGGDIIGQNVFNYLHNVLFFEDNNTLQENLLTKRGNRDSTIKFRQNKNIIDEFSTKKPVVEL
ncbi:uncharacterized protein LOC122499832 [Leptopilina heterotoma]|uniref:uncharacterized protein LOC122499832 n=1 Tax=Leptopilina heterotoma TaxID=63436 RepID=UPI001CA98C7A|nr:uncharacterized protein LOC122499832 [Leptopilina heterotoma]